MKTHTHADGLETEREAFAKVEHGIASMKEHIMADLIRIGERGLTPDEWADLRGGLINSVRRRFTDLWKEGLIKHHPELSISTNSNGNKCTRWVVGFDPDSVNYRMTYRQLIAEIDRLKAEIASLNRIRQRPTYKCQEQPGLF